MIFGITGGTGCGKTTALECFARLGGTVIDCDRVYHRLLTEDDALLSAIESRFPGTVQGGTLDRKALGTIVFSDKDQLQALNAITHTAVRQEVLRLIDGKDDPVAIDAIALFEGGLAPLCDITVAVTAPESTRISRLMARDGISEDYARARIGAQRPQSDFVKMCRFRLHNDGTQAEFAEKCTAFFRQWILPQ